jgi:hypothetical protein
LTNELSQTARRRCLFRTEGAKEKDRVVSGGADKIMQELETGLVGVVQVIKRKQDGRRCRKTPQQIGNRGKESLTICAYRRDHRGRQTSKVPDGIAKDRPYPPGRNSIGNWLERFHKWAIR